MFGFFAKRAVKDKEPIGTGFAITERRPPAAGEPVTIETAYRYSAFFACIRILSESCAVLPWHVYERAGSKRISVDHQIDTLISVAPNPETPPFFFKERMFSSIAASGNFYAEKERNGFGEIVALWPIDSSRVETKRDDKGKIIHLIDRETTLKSDDVFHVKGVSRGGLVGMSIIEQAKESISMGIASQAFGASFFGNGGLPSYLIVDKDGKSGIKPEGAKNLLDTLRKKHSPARNRHKVDMLDRGLSIEKIGLSPAEMQFIETADWSIYDLCRWFRIPPHKLGLLARSTHNNIESQNIEFVTDAILPLLKRAEDAANFFLFPESERGTYYSKFNVMALLRGDSKTRGEYYRLMRDLGVYDIDEIRELEDYDPVEEGQNVRLVPVNMTTIDRVKSGATQLNSTQSMRESAEKIIRDTAARLAKIEIVNAKKNLDADGIITFYVGHAQRMAEAFSAVFSLAFELSGESRTAADSALARLCADYVGRRADDLNAAIKSGNKTELLAQWEITSALQLSEKIIAEAF